MRKMRPLLLATLIVSACAGCHSKSGPEKTLELINQLGGKVKADDNLPDKPIVMVDLRGTAVSDEQLKALKELPQMQVLVLDSTRVSDAGLETLKEFGQLQRIFLRMTRVTAGGITELKKSFPKAEIVN